ncbi:MAG: PD-(D/E)XK nuclease family protein [Fusobacteriaceae bacterium]
MPVKKDKIIPKWVQENHILLDKLKSEGADIYSYSKLKSFTQCKGAYKDTYINKKKRANNVYAIIGSYIHDALEDIYDNSWSDVENKLVLEEGFQNALMEIGVHNNNTEQRKDFYGNLPEGEYYLKFMSENVEQNYMKAISHYINNFKRENVKRLNEALVVVELNGKYVQGFIDVIQEDENGDGQTLKIIDYKTSTVWASAEETSKHAQQLLFYAWAIMQKYPKLKVTSVSWNMLKYVNIKYHGKTRKTNTLFRRDKLFDKKQGILTEIYDAFKIKGYSDLDTAVILSEGMSKNQIPEEISDMFDIWEGYLDYPVTEENLLSTVNHLTEIMNDIDKEEIFEHMKITDKDNFNCTWLCNHRHTCEVRAKYFKSKLGRKEETLGAKFENIF